LIRPPAARSPSGVVTATTAERFAPQAEGHLWMAMVRSVGVLTCVIAEVACATPNVNPPLPPPSLNRHSTPPVVKGPTAVAAARALVTP
jgi:hypothetical protein